MRHADFADSAIDCGHSHRLSFGQPSSQTRVQVRDDRVKLTLRRVSFLSDQPRVEGHDESTLCFELAIGH